MPSSPILQAWAKTVGPSPSKCSLKRRPRPTLARRGAQRVESNLAGMGEDGRAVAFHVLVEAQAKASFGQHTSKRGLAHSQRITSQVVAVQLNEVEGVEEYALVSAVVTDEIERRHAVVIAGNSFAVDNAGARAQAGQRFDD